MIPLELKGPESEKQYQNIDFYRKGGMGEIYTANDKLTNKKKAVKIIPVDNRDEYDLLKTEFDISTSLKHKNIINTEYYNEFRHKAMTYLYCIMEFYENGSLRDYLQSQSDPININQLIKLMFDLSEGLDYAHKKIIHRDLKPENILLKDDGDLIICDFGLSKLIDSKTRTRTFKGAGTLPYMSPECWMFESNTHLMDIYSMGIIFYEIASLKMPFIGSSEIEFREKHLYESLPNISNERVDLPVRIVEMINKMTNKRPQERYSSMSDIVKILNEISKNIEVKADSKIDSLLKKANQKITSTEQKELEQKRQQEEIDTKLKFIDYSINSLFDIFDERIKELNISLERNEIISHRIKNNLTVSFMDKSFSASFYPYSDIQASLERRKQVLIEHQQRQFGMVFQTPEPSYIEKDNVILIGQVTLTSYSYDSQSWGYNLLLRKANPEDLYGEWWLVWFDDSPIINKSPLDYHYAIGIPEFYREYEIGRGNAMHSRTMGMNTLKSEGLDKLIEKILE